jgi:hypothetical protein
VALNRLSRVCVAVSRWLLLLMVWGAIAQPARAMLHSIAMTGGVARDPSNVFLCAISVGDTVNTASRMESTCQVGPARAGECAPPRPFLIHLTKPRRPREGLPHRPISLRHLTRPPHVTSQLSTPTAAHRHSAATIPIPSPARTHPHPHPASRPPPSSGGRHPRQRRHTQPAGGSAARS